MPEKIIYIIIKKNCATISNRGNGKKAEFKKKAKSIKYAGWSDAAKIVMSPNPRVDRPSKWHKIKKARVLNDIEQQQ